MKIAVLPMLEPNDDSNEENNITLPSPDIITEDTLLYNRYRSWYRFMGYGEQPKCDFK